MNEQFILEHIRKIESDIQSLMKTIKESPVSDKLFPDDWLYIEQSISRLRRFEQIIKFKPNKETSK